MPNLMDVLPDVGDEIIRSLEARGEAALAATVPALPVLDRCRCGDDFCAMVYTAPRPEGAHGPGLRNLQIEASEGVIILDVVERRIMGVEVLFRPGAREAVQSVLH